MQTPLKVDDEMVRAFFQAAMEQAGRVARAKSPADLDGSIHRAGLAAVLAIVARDYHVEPKRVAVERGRA
jgi:hypothetical protein